jgi:hypothetical protein
VCASGVHTVHALPSLSTVVLSPSSSFDHSLSAVVRGSGLFVVRSHSSFIVESIVVQLIVVRSFVIQSFVVQLIVVSEVVGGVVKDEERWWERHC